MEDLKVVFASNLIALRNKAGLTQAELGAKISYSDKSISKWERAEALPDVTVVKNLADIFQVSVDFMLTTHDQWQPEQRLRQKMQTFDTKMVTCISISGIWTLAMLLFVIFWIIGQKIWLIFIGAIPASLITLLILNTLWNEKKHTFVLVGGIVAGVFAVIYYVLRSFHPWQLIFVLALSELMVILSSKVKRVEPQDGEQDILR